MLDLCLANSRILFFWYALESIHKVIIELHVLQHLFVRRSNKKQSEVSGGTTKGGTFFISYDDQVLLGVISHYGPLLAPFRKGLPLPFSLAKKRIYLDTQLKGALTDLL